MKRRLLKSIAFAAVALSLATASCDSLPTDVQTPVTTSVEATASVPVESAAAVRDGGYFFVTKSTSTSSGGLLGGLLGGLTTTLTNTVNGVLELVKIIGINGGSLALNKHELDVPRGAVLLPTTFTMRTPTSGRIEVELTATLRTLFGIIDVGENGFLKPVELTLSYAQANNVSNPSRLKIALLNDDGSIAEILPTTVNTWSKTVSAKLPHFSRYVLVCD